MQNIFAVSGLINAIVSIFFSVIVIAKNRKSKTNIICSLLTAATAFWSFFYWRWLLVSDDQTKALLLVRILSLGSIIIPVLFFHWILVLFKIREKKKLLIFYYLLTFGYSLFFNSNLFVKNVVSRGGFYFWPQPGLVYTLFIITHYIILLLYGIYLLLDIYRKSGGIVKLQAKYVLVGSIIGFGGGATNFLLWYGINIPPVGNFLVVFYVLFFSFAIIKYRLMGIRFVASKVYVFLSLSLSIFLFFRVLFFIHSFLHRIGENSYLLVIDIVAAFLFSLLFFPLLSYIQRSSDIIFFKGHNPRLIIKDLMLRLGSVIELEQLLKILKSEFKKILATDNVSILFDIRSIKDKKNQLGFTIARKSEIKKMVISTKNPLYRVLADTKESVVRDELTNNRKNKLLLKEMKKRNVMVASPLRVRGKIVGAILLGEKINQSAYSQEDIEFLDIISSQAAVAIENALLYEEAKRFNVKLKRKVEEATKDLKKTNRKLILANQKLQTLDQAKSEFISIASHQLRTPLTSIKGFISLLMEGSYGKISKSVQAVLEKIYISNERLIKLVEDLLNVSRIESGKISFNFANNDIEKTILETLETFKIMAKSRNVELSFHNQSRRKIPPFCFDKSKIQEVISNLVDNSFKYTNQGSVKVFLRDMGKKVQVEVRDTGIGIDPEDLPNLFQKFRRGKETSKLYTEGTGLGLFVCKKIIESHQGKIWAESKGKNKGSRFIFELRKDLKES